MSDSRVGILNGSSRVKSSLVFSLPPHCLHEVFSLEICALASGGRANVIFGKYTQIQILFLPLILLVAKSESSGKYLGKPEFLCL